MTRPLSLCLIAEHFHPTLTGAGERFRRYLPGLRRRGVETSVFTPAQEGLPSQEWVDGAKVYRLPLPASGRRKSVELERQVLQFYKDCGQWPDVAHVLSHTLSGVPYMWGLRLHGVPCVNSITMYPGSLSGGLPARLRYRLHQQLRYSPFQILIVASRVGARALREFGIRAQRIRVIPNGVDTERFQPPTDPAARKRLRQALSFYDGDALVLFVGYISKRKGVDLLLECWPAVRSRQPNAGLLLIGPMEEQDAFTSWFDEKVNSLSSERVQYLPPAAGIEAYYQAADILVLPSRLEGMPNVVIEAMACGLTSVITPFDGLPETLGRPEENFLLSSYQPERLAEDISGLIADPARRAALAAAGLRSVRTGLDIETALERHFEIYRALAGQAVQGATGL